MFTQGFGTQAPSLNVKLRSARKAGPAVFATYRPVGATCPQSCPMLGNGCYAEGGNVNMHQRQSGHMTFNALAWARTLPAGALVRWNVSGDIVGTDGAAYRGGILRAHTSRPDLTGWLYTHAWRDLGIAAWAARLPANVRAVASCDTKAEVAAARALAFQTIATVATGTADGHWDRETADRARADYQPLADSIGLPLVVCPAQRKDKAPVGCADCGACKRDGLILFAAHGFGTRKVNARLAVIK